MLLACMFALGFATGIGVGVYQTAIFLIYKPTKKELPHD